MAQFARLLNVPLLMEMTAIHRPSGRERWRPAFLAATTNVLHSPASASSPLLREAREALANL